jgi:predicted ABC-type ATPase
MNLKRMSNLYIIAGLNGSGKTTFVVKTGSGGFIVV